MKILINVLVAHNRWDPRFASQQIRLIGAEEK